MYLKSNWSWDTSVLFFSCVKVLPTFFFFLILVGPPQPKKKNNNDALVWNEAPRRSRGVSFKVILVAQEAQGARRSREAERSAECRDIILPESF